MKTLKKGLIAASAALMLVFAADCPAQSQDRGADMNGDCSDTSKKDQWPGTTLSEAQTRLGEPIEDETFKLSEAVLSEFRIGLYKIRQRLESGEDLTVREVTWPAEGDCRLTLWFKDRDGGPAVFDTLYWNRLMEF